MEAAWSYIHPPLYMAQEQIKLRIVTKITFWASSICSISLQMFSVSSVTKSRGIAVSTPPRIRKPVRLSFQKRIIMRWSIRLEYYIKTGNEVTIHGQAVILHM